MTVEDDVKLSFMHSHSEVRMDCMNVSERVRFLDLPGMLLNVIRAFNRITLCLTADRLEISYGWCGRGCCSREITRRICKFVIQRLHILVRLGDHLLQAFAAAAVPADRAFPEEAVPGAGVVNECLTQAFTFNTG